MKRLAMTLIASFVLTAVCFGQGEESTTSAGSIARPLSISIVYPIQLVAQDQSVHGLRLNLIHGDNQSLSGLDLGLINCLDDSLRGYLYGLVIYVGGDFLGAQTAIAVNLVRGGGAGEQLALVNFLDHDLAGWQVGAINRAGSVEGCQIGLVNFTEALTGLQVGVVNWTDDLDGLQIGILNFAVGKESWRVLPIVNAAW